MKTIIAMMLLGSSAAALAQTTGVAGVAFSWSGDGNTSLPGCSATVTAACLTTFTITDITTASAPLVISSTIPYSTLTYMLTPLPAVGAHTYSLMISGKDQSGNAISSAPITATVTVPAITLNPPTGLQVVP
jgi:hypothetical protein